MDRQEPCFPGNWVGELASGLVKPGFHIVRKAMDGEQKWWPCPNTLAGMCPLAMTASEPCLQRPLVAPRALSWYHRLDCIPCNLMFRTSDFLTVKNAETIRNAGSRFPTTPHLHRPESSVKSSLAEFKLIPGSAA